MVFNNSRSTEEKLDYVRKNQSMLLVAFDDEKQVGFKLGYVIPGTRTFFSWLGGVHPDYRRRGIGQQLLEQQESIAKDLKMDTIYFTSYDRFEAMITLGKKNGYGLLKAEEDSGEMKYWYQKHLPS